jgi:hypothetical protein
VDLDYEPITLEDMDLKGLFATIKKQERRKASRRELMCADFADIFLLS